MTQLRMWVTRAAATAVALAPASVMAQLTDPQPFGGTSQQELVPAILSIVNTFLLLAGILAAIFLVIGGVQYIISRGDESAAATAKNTILYAIIGLIVIGLSAAIIRFVFTAF